MKTFTLTDLKNHTGKVVDAAIRAPVSLTKHGTAALVILSQDEFDRRMARIDPRESYRLDELPAGLGRDLAASLAGVTQDSYGDD
jgi:prevent-host-death family protein